MKKKRRQVIAVASEEVSTDSYDISNATKSDALCSFLKSAIRGEFLFASISDEQLSEVVLSMKLLEMEAQEFVCQENTRGDVMYVIESGQCEVIKKGKTVNIIGKGMVFGELGLVYNSPRSASIRVTSTLCKLWTLERSTFRSIKAVHISDDVIERQDFLKNVELLSDLESSQICKLADAMTTREFQPGQVIISQGDTGDTFYIIKVSKKCDGKYTFYSASCSLALYLVTKKHPQMTPPLTASRYVFSLSASSENAQPLFRWPSWTKGTISVKLPCWKIRCDRLQLSWGMNPRCACSLIVVRLTTFWVLCWRFWERKSRDRS